MSELAIRGGKALRTEPYPEWPVFDERDIQAVTDVIRSGRWGGYPYPGPRTQAFLRKFEEMQGGGYGVAVVNGTVTMEVALRAADIGPHPLHRMDCHYSPELCSVCVLDPLRS